MNLLEQLRNKIGSSESIAKLNDDELFKPPEKLTKYDKELDRFYEEELKKASYKTFSKENEPMVDSNYFLMAKLSLTSGVYEELSTARYSYLVTKLIAQEWRIKNKAILHPIQICASCGKVWNVSSQGQLCPTVDTCRSCFNNGKHKKNLGNMHYIRFIGYLMTHLPFAFYTYILTSDDKLLCESFEELNPQFFNGKQVPASVIDISGIYGSI